jgi:hypothetical protein
MQRITTGKCLYTLKGNKVKKLRFYYVEGKYTEGSVVGVIAYTAKEAKEQAVGEEELSDEDYIDLRVKWQKNANIKGLPPGVVPGDFDALKRGLYHDLFGQEVCPRCGKKFPDRIYYEENIGICCNSCIGDKVPK